MIITLGPATADDTADGPQPLIMKSPVPDVDEAEALVAAVAGLGVPAWLTYSVDDDCTRAGQPLAEAFAVPVGVPEIVAVGVNCCTPSNVPAAIAVARQWIAQGARVVGGCCRVGPDPALWTHNAVPRLVEQRYVSTTRAALTPRA
jgi:homocysteine S-methyltransferase